MSLQVSALVGGDIGGENKGAMSLLEGVVGFSQFAGGEGGRGQIPAREVQQQKTTTPREHQPANPDKSLVYGIVVFFRKNKRRERAAKKRASDIGVSQGER